MTRSQLSFGRGPFILLAGLSAFWFSDTIADPDLWGHIRFGQDILRSASVVQTDIYSYRSGEQPWINHEWLSEVIFGHLYNRLGPFGLNAAKLMVSLLLLALCFAHLRRRGLGPFRSILLLILISFPFRMGLGTVRPQMFTYLFFLLELLLLERATATSEHWLWMLPILCVAWINLHGGVLAGVVFLDIWIVARLVVRTWESPGRRAANLAVTVRLGLLGLICGSALFCNPYGAELVLFLLRTATVPRPEIREWVPIAVLSLPGQVYLGLIAIGVVALARSRRRASPEAIAIFIAAAVLPLISNRHYPLFAMTLVVMVGEHIADVWNRWWRAGWSRFGQSRFVVVANVLASILLMSFALARLGCIRVESFYFNFPARAVAFLKQSGVRGNMAVPFDWGEYVIWHLGPDVKVSMDGRRETLYSDEAYRQSRDFELGTGAWHALLKTSKADLVLAPIGSPTANLLSGTAGWVPLYRDTLCVIFIRDGFPQLGQILNREVPALPDNGDGLCFPAPAENYSRAGR
jgi:hypothetical protein